MAGRWHAFLSTAEESRGEPRARELKGEADWAHPTKAAAIAALKEAVSREMKAVQERAAELGRALAAIREMES